MIKAFCMTGVYKATVVLIPHFLRWEKVGIGGD